MSMKMKKILMQEAGEAPDGGGQAPVETTEVETPQEGSFDWQEFSKDAPETSEEVVEEKEVAPASEPAPAPVAKPVEQPAPTPAAQSVANVQPQPIQPQTVAPTPPAEPTPQPAPVVQQPQAPVETAEQLEAKRTQYLESLTERYALSEEESTTVMVEPEKVLPKMAAQIHANIAQDVINTIFGYMPQYMTQYMAQQQQSAAIQERFFGEWPALREAAKDPAVSEKIVQHVAAWKRVNPQADLDSTIREAGIYTMLSLRMPLPPEMLQSAVQQQQPVTPTFVPAAPGSATTSGVPRPQPTNPYEILANDFLQDDSM